MTAYDWGISDWSSDVCSSDLPVLVAAQPALLDGTHRGAPLGIARSVWPTATIDVDPPWCLLMFTDGLFEPKLDDGTRLGLEGMVDLLQGVSVPQSEEDLDQLLDTMQQIGRAHV